MLKSNFSVVVIATSVTKITRFIVCYARVILPNGGGTSNSTEFFLWLICADNESHLSKKLSF